MYFFKAVNPHNSINDYYLHFIFRETESKVPQLINSRTGIWTNIILFQKHYAYNYCISYCFTASQDTYIKAKLTVMETLDFKECISFLDVIFQYLIILICLMVIFL